MKNNISRIVALALAIMLLGAAALCEVRTTGNVWLRANPDKESEQVTSYPENTSLEYLGETSVDDRGVAWYKVKKGEYTGWVSSRYSELIGEESNVVETQPTADAQPAAETGSSWFTDGAADAENGVEVAGYYRVQLMAAATALSLTNFRSEDNSEVPYQYYNDALTIAGNTDVEYIGVSGAGYTVYGVSVGMDAAAATDALVAAGLDFIGGDDTLVFEHRAEGNVGYVNEAGHDSCINLYVTGGTVGQIDWSTYTG